MLKLFSKKRTKSEILSELIPVMKSGNYKLSQFRKGQIYKMNPASRSHVDKPYYIEILKTGFNFIITNIPEYHSLKIEYPSFKWDYHIPRMEYIGDDSEARKLIYNQNIFNVR